MKYGEMMRNELGTDKLTENSFQTASITRIAY